MRYSEIIQEVNKDAAVATVAVVGAVVFIGLKLARAF